MGQALAKKSQNLEKVSDYSERALMKQRSLIYNRISKLFNKKNLETLCDEETDLSVFMTLLNNCDTELALKLLNPSVDSASEKNNMGQTALHLAFVKKASKKVIDILLDSALKMSTSNLVDDQGLSYLHIACATKNIDQVRKLLEVGYNDINCQVAYDADLPYAGQTPLHFAVGCGQIQIVELLLNHGADIYIPDIKLTTPVHLAVELRDIEMIDLLLKYDKRRENMVNRYGVSHFMAACAGSDHEIVKQFIRACGSYTLIAISSMIRENRSDPSYPNTGYSSLHFAIEFGRIETTRLLLDWGADCAPETIEFLRNAAPSSNHQEVLTLVEEEYADRQRLLEMLTDRQNY